jgi:hypothetical protein
LILFGMDHFYGQNASEWCDEGGAWFWTWWFRRHLY